MPGLAPYIRQMAIGERQTITRQGSTVFVRRADGQLRVTLRSLQVGSGKGGEEYSLRMVQADKWFHADTYDQVIIENVSGVANLIELYLGVGDFSQPVPDIVNVEFEVPQDVNVVSSNPSPAPSSVIDSQVDLTVDNLAVVQLLPANPARVRALISAPSANAGILRIGDAAVTATNGTPLAAGETLPLDTTAAIFAIAQATGANSAARVELLL